MRDNGKYCYPTETSNRNVPKDVFLVAESVSMSGEIVQTYYIDRNGFYHFVYDWVGDRSYYTTMHDLCRATGDIERMVRARYELWKEKCHEGSTSL